MEAIATFSTILAFPLEAVANPSHRARLQRSGGAGRILSSRGDACEQDAATFLLQRMDALAVPGVRIAVTEDHGIVWATAYGVTTKGPGGAPVTPGTLL